jgi:prepilin-type N-terminal cleavage/methylation domain-containing protein
MKKYCKGFTLIELLTVITIIGILTIIILLTLNKARGDANVAAFKAEVLSASAPATLRCDDSNTPLDPGLAILIPVTATDNVSWSKIGSGWSCGLNGTGSFILKAEPIRAMPSDNSACTTGMVIVDKTGAHFPAGC